MYFQKLPRTKPIPLEGKWSLYDPDGRLYTGHLVIITDRQFNVLFKQLIPTDYADVQHSISSRHSPYLRDFYRNKWLPECKKLKGAWIIWGMGSYKKSELLIADFLDDDFDEYKDVCW